MSIKRAIRLKHEEYVNGILAKDRLTLSRAITVIESTLPSDRALAQQILQPLLSHTGNSVRIGITGVPGVGKSTFIEKWGELVTSLGHSLAVLTIDPSSTLGRGSILGDKTRMEELSHNPKAYIRPSPTGTSLGGVTARTRETMLLCEAAGFDVIFIETVGVGQSETAVRGMVDFFLLLMLAGAGDELQGIKKGIMEMADGLVITKADGSNLTKAKQAQREYANALHLFQANPSGWTPKVLITSALDNSGLDKVWDMVAEHTELDLASSQRDLRRKDQNLTWLHDTIRHDLLNDFYSNDKIKQDLVIVEKEIMAGKIPVNRAANNLLKKYWER